MRGRNAIVAAVGSAAVIGDTVAVNRIAIAGSGRAAVLAAAIGGTALLAVAAAAGFAWSASRVLEVVGLAAAAAALVGIASVAAWDPAAGSATCAGPSDCDNGYAVGAMALTVAVFIPTVAAALAGWGARRLTHNDHAPGSPVPPAGWYPDPWRQARWRLWDGAQWTGHARH